MMGDIKAMSRQARKVAFNAQVVAAGAGEAGKEFAMAAGAMTTVTAQIDDLVHAALNGAIAR